MVSNNFVQGLPSINQTVETLNLSSRFLSRPSQLITSVIAGAKCCPEEAEGQVVCVYIKQQDQPCCCCLLTSRILMTLSYVKYMMPQSAICYKASYHKNISKDKLSKGIMLEILQKAVHSCDNLKSKRL